MEAVQKSSQKKFDLQVFLQERRNSLDLSIHAMARHCNISSAYYYDLERGRSRAEGLTISTLRKMSRGLGLKPSTLVRKIAS